MPKFHVPKPSDPDVEVLIDGAWCQGELRMWTQHDDGTWTAQVQYQPPDVTLESSGHSLPTMCARTP
jgi:hypothetical protein